MIYALTPEERERYARQIILPEIGEEGQLRLKQGSVLVIGAGGLGSPILLYLAAAGVGRIGIADGDKVDCSNLQRQVIHTNGRQGIKKVDSAAAAINDLNPNIRVERHPLFVNTQNIYNLIDNYDFIIDATDSFDAKFLINDACVKVGKPLSHGAIFRYQGHTTTILPGDPCYRCLFSSMPKGDLPVGPFGVVPGVIGTLQATETLKYLTGTGTLMSGKLLRFDARTLEFSQISFNHSPDCPHHSFS